MKRVFLVAAILGLLGAAFLQWQKHRYKLMVQDAEQQCNILAISHSDTDPLPHEIDCALVHHDVLITFRLGPNSNFYWDCLPPDQVMIQRLTASNCKFYRRQ